MKTVQVEDNQEALDVLMQHNSFAQAITSEKISDDVVRIYAMQIAVLRLIEKIVRGDALRADVPEAEEVIATIDAEFADEDSELYRLKYYGSRELSEELATLRGLVEQAKASV